MYVKGYITVILGHIDVLKRSSHDEIIIVSYFGDKNLSTGGRLCAFMIPSTTSTRSESTTSSAEYKIVQTVVYLYYCKLPIHISATSTSGIHCDTIVPRL